MAKKTYQLIGLETEIQKRFGDLSSGDMSDQMNNLISVLDLDPTVPDLTAEKWKEALSVLDVVKNGQAADYVKAKEFLASAQAGEVAEQAITVTSNSNPSSASSDSTEIVAQALDFRTEDAVEKLCDGFDERDKEVAGQVIRAYDALMLQKITEAAASGRMNSKVSMAIEDIGGLGKFPLLERVEAKIAARNQKLLESSTDSSDPPSETT